MDPRDEIWNEAYYLHYNTYYAEISEERLDARWSHFDHVSRILVAATSSGSAIAGFALWKDPSLYWMWPLLSSISAIFALLSKHFGVAEKLRDHANSCNALSSLRIDVENFRTKMRTDPAFSVQSFQKELFALKKKYGAELARVKHDIFLTKRLKSECQEELDSKLDK